jgi:endoplasmic reticulum protein 29
MEKIMERGDVFVQTEQTRIEGLLMGKLSNDKKRSMEERRNILQSFTHRDEL